MPQLIPAPTSIPVPGGKVIEEYVGLVNTATESMSVAHMRAPADWDEPAQTPDFDEVTLVLEGSVLVDAGGDTLRVSAGQALLTTAGETVRYRTDEPARYVAVCLPAFSPDGAHRAE